MELQNITDGKETVTGAVEKITYRNEENGYTVCHISRDDEKGRPEMVTLVGIMPMVNVGETINAVGKWSFHQTFGRQFSVEYFEKQLPTSTSAILSYLSSKTIKGIGPKTAVKIVAKFGESTFEVIEKDPDRLAKEVSGISPQKAKEISDSFKEQFGVRAVMMFCRDYFGPATAVKIYKRWGGAAVDMMRENPYVLCDEIHGIGFEKADKVARSLGIEENSPQRVRSGVIYVLSYNAQSNGHTLMPRDRLEELASVLLKVDKELCSDAIDVLAFKKRVVLEKVSGRECVYLANYHKAEHYICEKMDLLDESCSVIKSDGKQLIAETEKSIGIEFDDMQKKAILHSLLGGVLVLTGGPGTGKTTVIRGIIQLFSSLKKTFILAAPTGRAAKRMTEATGYEAKTIHRMLEMMYADDREPGFMRDANNPLDEELIIIDEASMVDTLLMESLLRAIRPGSRLILIGDSDQLPSVGAGNVLSDILASERYRTVKLKKIFRQAGESMIVTNAHAINSGELPELDCKTKDFFFMERPDDVSIAQTVAQLCVHRLPKKYGEHLIDQIQVITPSHKGAAGTEALNILLQSQMNPPSPRKREKRYRETVFREGDRVMQIKNDYDITWEKDGEEGCGIFNGDIGIIISVLNDDECLMIDFEGRLTRYDYTMLDELEHAYAITIHKSQGSEYPYVIIPIYNCGDRLLTRNLLYTAVTRAQEMVILVGRCELVARMVENNRQTKRYNGLKALLSK